MPQKMDEDQELVRFQNDGPVSSSTNDTLLQQKRIRIVKLSEDYFHENPQKFCKIVAYARKKQQQNKLEELDRMFGFPAGKKDLSKEERRALYVPIKENDEQMRSIIHKLFGGTSARKIKIPIWRTSEEVAAFSEWLAENGGFSGFIDGDEPSWKKNEGLCYIAFLRQYCLRNYRAADALHEVSYDVVAEAVTVLYNYQYSYHKKDPRVLRIRRLVQQTDYENFKPCIFVLRSEGCWDTKVSSELFLSMREECNRRLREYFQKIGMDWSVKELNPNLAKGEEIMAQLDRLRNIRKTKFENNQSRKSYPIDLDTIMSDEDEDLSLSSSSSDVDGKQDNKKSIIIASDDEEDDKKSLSLSLSDVSEDDNNKSLSLSLSDVSEDESYVEDYIEAQSSSSRVWVNEVEKSESSSSEENEKSRSSSFSEDNDDEMTKSEYQKYRSIESSDEENTSEIEAENQMFTVSAEIAEKNQSSSTLLPVTNFASENSNSHFKRKSDLESLETFGKKYRLDDSGESCLEKSKAQQDKINNNFDHLVEKIDKVREELEEVEIDDDSSEKSLSIGHASDEEKDREDSSDHNILDIFEKQWQDQEFCDVKLVLSCGKEVLANKFVLSAWSPLFSDIFKNSNSREKAVTAVKIKHLSYEVLIEMLRFMYSGKLDDELDQKTVGGLLAAAHRFRINQLKFVCKEYLMKNLNVENALLTLKISKTYCIDDLLSHVNEFVRANAKLIYFNSVLKEYEDETDLYFELDQDLADKIPLPH